MQITKHVGMTANELGGDGFNDTAEIERALLLRHAGMEHDLKEEVAQFFTEVC